MKTNCSFPHPVLGINKGIIPDLEEDALVLENAKIEDKKYVYTFQLQHSNRQIENYIKEGFAQYICEVDCPKTCYKRTFPSKDGKIVTDFKTNEVVGHVNFSFYIVTLKAMPNYQNANFNPDYKDPVTGKLPSFYLETGSVLAVFPQWSENVTLRFNNKPELNSLIQVVKDQTAGTEVSIELTSTTINVILPGGMYNQFLAYNQEKYKGFFFLSILNTALIKGILNLKESESDWADSITEIFNSNPNKFKGLKLDDPADAVDIAQKMLTNQKGTSPYDLLFESITNMENE